jgi:two-component system KDP operon response regulator KdpE
MRSLHSTLAALRLRVRDVGTGEQAMADLRQSKSDIVLLDLNMPGIGGMATCRMMRQAYPGLTIIVLTVRDHDDDKVAALDAGADDYVTKPFQLSELLARIRATLRRIALQARTQDDVIQVDELQVGELQLYPAERRVAMRGHPLHLTPKEFDLLHILMSHAGRPLTHRFLLTSVWGSEYGEEREYLRTYVNQLRRKIEDKPSSPHYLHTENYFGYRFLDSPEQET